MASRNNGKSPNSRRPSGGRSGGEIDRYNYVDRDIYSSGNRDVYSASDRKSSNRNSSGNRGSGKGRKKKRRGRGKRTAVVFLSFVGVLVLCVAVFGGIMLSRVDRSDNGDPESYVQQPSAAPAWDVMGDDKVMNVLLIGADRMEDNIQRSDSMILLSIDNKNKKLKLTSFLRDSYLEIPTIGKDKLNASFSNGGPILTMQTLENNFRVNIDRYVMVDFDSFAALIDKMGGIEVVVSQSEADEMNRVKDCNLSAGKNHMRGTLALYFARMRFDSDFGRTGRQRQVIGCMLDKLKTLNPVEVTGVMYDYLQYVKTNLTDSELAYLGLNALKMANYPMETMHVPVKNGYEDAKLDSGAQVLKLDLEKNCEALREFLYGTGRPEDS